ncbi:MAG: hypothetical protein QXV32_02040 [Conexivisphaerales archaeon]
MPPRRTGGSLSASASGKADSEDCFRPSLFQKIFRAIVHRNALSDFWRSIIKRYRANVKLDNNKIRYIIKQKQKGRSSIAIADSLQISSRRVQQIYKQFMDTGIIPLLKKAGRKGIQISEVKRREEKRRLVTSSFAKYMMNALYLSKMIAIDRLSSLYQP